MKITQKLYDDLFLRRDRIMAMETIHSLYKIKNFAVDEEHNIYEIDNYKLCLETNANNYYSSILEIYDCSSSLISLFNKKIKILLNSKIKIPLNSQKKNIVNTRYVFTENFKIHIIIDNMLYYENVYYENKGEITGISIENNTVKLNVI